jgi:flagellar biogenesis protein FliO
MKPATHAVQHAIPFKRDIAAGEPSLASSGVGMLVVSLMAIAAVLVVRKRLRLGQPQGGRPALLKVLESQRLGPRAVVSVVLFNNIHYLLAQGEHGVTCIATAPAGEAP